MPLSKKIVLVGPKCVGKTALANYLNDKFDTDEDRAAKAKLNLDTYTPTAGTRILEMTVKGFDVELWDTSGDHKYESCWKAMMTEADGVILVYNPDAPAQDEQIEDWFDFFVRKNGLQNEQCMAIAFRTNQGTTERFRAPPLFSKVTAALVSANNVSDVVDMFVDIATGTSSIMGDRSRK
jgi:intraflagellar transport protein 22